MAKNASDIFMRASALHIYVESHNWQRDLPFIGVVEASILKGVKSLYVPKGILSPFTPNSSKCGADLT